MLYKKENPNVVEFKFKDDATVDECLACFNDSSIISCMLDFSSYIPNDDKMLALVLALEANPHMEKFRLISGSDNLSNSTIEIMTNALVKFKHLKALVVKGSFFNHNSAKSFAELIMNSDKLEALTLSENGYYAAPFSEENIELLSQALSINTSLWHIDFSGNRNQLSLEAGITLCQALSNNKNLRKINLKNNNFPLNGQHLILDVLYQNENLSSISLDNLTFTSYQFQLTINDNYLDHYLRMLQKNPNITSVDLVFKSNSNTNLEPFFKSLMHLKHLENLRLISFPSSLIPLLVKLFEQNDIKKLSYSGIIDLINFFSFSEMLQNSKLESISLDLDDKYKNNISNRIFKELFNSGFNNCLQSLKLRYKRISPESAESIGKFLNRTTSLTSLDLSSNPMSYQSLRIIIDSVNNNQTLRELDLSYNGCSFDRCDFIYISGKQLYGRTFDTSAYSLKGSKLYYHKPSETDNHAETELEIDLNKDQLAALKRVSTSEIVNLSQSQLDKITAITGHVHHAHRELAFLESLKLNTRLTQLNLVDKSNYAEFKHPTFQINRLHGAVCEILFGPSKGPDNNLSYQSYCNLENLMDRNLNSLIFSCYQKFLLLKLLIVEKNPIPLDLVNIIFNLLILKAVGFREKAIFEDPSQLNSILTLKANNKVQLEDKLIQTKCIQAQPEKDFATKLNDLTSRFLNNVEISNHIRAFDQALKAIFHEGKGAKQQDLQKLNAFAQQATELLESVIDLRKNKDFLKNIKKDLDSFQQNLPQTSSLSQFYGVLNAVMAVFSALVETLLLPVLIPLSCCLEKPIYRATGYFADNCYCMFNSPLNPPLKIINELRESLLDSTILIENTENLEPIRAII
ncbi:MAG: hypothetical protein H0U70_13285 [Tatlockia sp.]|nr:hypothetical protein [Tatlockia sp.]